MIKMLDFPDLQEPRPFTDAEQKAIDDLKEMFQKKPEINFQTDNYFLTKFLRYRDWNAQAAYDSIVHYYKLKVKLFRKSFKLELIFVFSLNKKADY